jgi:hypothetical protein
MDEQRSSHPASEARGWQSLSNEVLTGERNGNRAACLTLSCDSQGAQTRPLEPSGAN